MKLSDKIKRAIDHTYTVTRALKEEWLADALELEEPNSLECPDCSGDVFSRPDNDFADGEDGYCPVCGLHCVVSTDGETEPYAVAVYPDPPMAIAGVVEAPATDATSVWIAQERDGSIIGVYTQEPTEEHRRAAGCPVQEWSFAQYGLETVMTTACQGCPALLDSVAEIAQLRAALEQGKTTVYIGLPRNVSWCGSVFWSRRGFDEYNRLTGGERWCIKAEVKPDNWRDLVDKDDQPVPEPEGSPLYDLCETCEKAARCELACHTRQSCDNYRGPRPQPTSPVYTDAPEPEGGELLPCEMCGTPCEVVDGEYMPVPTESRRSAEVARYPHIADCAKCRDCKDPVHDYHIPDDLWADVVGEEIVLCWDCFAARAWVKDGDIGLLARAPLPADPSRSAEVAEVISEMDGEIVAGGDAIEMGAVRSWRDKLAGSAPPIPEITPEIGERLARESAECSKAMAAKVDKMRRGSAPAEPSPDAKVLADEMELIVDQLSEGKAPDGSYGKLWKLIHDVRHRIQPEPAKASLADCITAARLGYMSGHDDTAESRYGDPDEVARDLCDDLVKEGAIAVMQPEPAKKCDKLECVELNDKYLDLARVVAERDAALAKQKPEPAKAPAIAWAVQVAPCDPVYFASSPDAREYADAAGPVATISKIEIFGAAEGECEHDRPGGLVHRNMFDQAIAERDAALAELEEAKLDLVTIHRELEAERQAHEETRENRDAWATRATDLSIEIGRLRKRVAELEARLDARHTCKHSKACGDDGCHPACEDFELPGPPEPSRPHGQKGQAMKGPQPGNPDRTGAPTLGINAPNGRVKGPEPDADRMPARREVLPPHPEPKK